MTSPLEHIAVSLRALETRDPNALEVVVLHQPDPAPWCMCGGIAWRHTTNQYWTDTEELGQTSVPWDDLHAAIGNDPRIPPIRRWTENLPTPSWRYTTRPYVFRHNPGGFHPMYAQNDFTDPEWPARRRHWETLLQILRDARARIEQHTTPNTEQLNLFTHLDTMEGAPA